MALVNIISKMNLALLIVLVTGVSTEDNINVIQITESKVHEPRQADSLLKYMDSEEWTDDEEECRDATISLLNAVKNQTLWATWIWDSMQLPVAVLYGSRYHLGSFDQCLEDPWSRLPTQYCLVDVQLTEDTRMYEEVDPDVSVEEYVRIRTKHGRRRLNIYSFGVCLPAVCSPSSVAKISHHIHHQSHLPLGKISLDPRNCQKNEKLEYTFGYYAFWSIICSTTFIAVAVYLIHDSFCYIKNPKLIKIANWFSPSLNLEALLKINNGEMRTLNGLRACSAVAVIVLHYYYYVDALATINSVDIEKTVVSLTGQFVVQLTFVVDTFFVLSGLLHMKGIMANSSNLLQLLLKRYLRLLVPFAMSLLFMSSVLTHAVSGPLRPRLMREQQESCDKNWWWCLLLVNNYSYLKTDEICHVVTWYLACDYQLTILGTVLFFLCRRMRRQTAVVFCLVVYLISTVVPAVLTYQNELPPLVVYDNDEAAHMVTNRVFQTTYIKSHSHASAYLIGLAMGYMLHSYKPMFYQAKISKLWSVIGGTLGIIILFTAMVLGSILNTGTYNALYASVYAALDRSFFALGLSMLIIVCEYGTFPLVGDFLKSIMLVPLSRLSYGVYLFHSAFICMSVYSARSPYTFNFYHLLVNGLGYATVMFIISYLLWFIVEAPMINIINSLFRNSDRQMEHQNGTKKPEVRQNEIKQTKVS